MLLDLLRNGTSYIKDRRHRDSPILFSCREYSCMVEGEGPLTVAGITSSDAAPENTNRKVS